MSRAAGHKPIADSTSTDFVPRPESFSSLCFRRLADKQFCLEQLVEQALYYGSPIVMLLTFIPGNGIP